MPVLLSRNRTRTLLEFGANAVGTTTTGRYLGLGTDNRLAATTPAPLELPFAGKLCNLQVLHTDLGTGSNPLRYVVRVNTGNTALFVDVLPGASAGGNSADEVTVSAGDLVDVVVLKLSGPITLSPRRIVVSMEVQT